MKWVKRLVLPVGIVVVVIGTVVEKWMEDRADGTIVVFAPPDAPIKNLLVDGQRVEVAAGGFFRFRAKHGVHHIEIPDKLARDIEIKSGRDRFGVPTRIEQCFEELDVTLSHYGSTAGKTPPTVARAFMFKYPFRLPSYALDESELPKSASERVGSDGKIKSMQLVFLFKSAPCRDGLKYGTML